MKTKTQLPVELVDIRQIYFTYDSQGKRIKQVKIVKRKLAYKIIKFGDLEVKAHRVTIAKPDFNKPKEVNPETQYLRNPIVVNLLRGATSIAQENEFDVKFFRQALVYQFDKFVNKLIEKRFTPSF